MADSTVISRSSRVRGRLTGEGDLEILGHVEGEIEIAGDVTVDTQGLVAANVTAQRIVVRGAVKGDLTASDAVVLEEGAKVVGDVRAPRVAIAPGAFVRGYVETAGSGGPARARSRTQAAAGVGAAPARAPLAVAKVAAAAPARLIAAPTPAAAPSRPHVVAPAAVAATAPKPAIKVGPPAPVVPVLKKGVKGALNKKRA